MARINIDRVRGIPDIISTGEFEFILGRIPGWGSDRELTVKCQQAVYPDMGTESYEVPLHGHVVNFRGRKMMQRQLNVTYVEDRFLNTTNAFNRWLEFVVGTSSGTSEGYKEDYALNQVQLITYDPVGEPIDVVEFYGLFPQTKAEVQYDGSSSQMYIVNMTFVYDYYISLNTGAR